MAANFAFNERLLDVPAVKYKRTFVKIGELLQRETTTTTSVGFSNWEITAEMLGFEPSQINAYRAKAEISKSFPGALILEHWALMGTDRTLFVLRQVLMQQERLDCVSVIDTAVKEQNQMTLFLRIECGNGFKQEIIETSTYCTLEECLKARLEQMGGIKNFTIAKENSSVGWNTTAGQFKGVILTVKRSRSVSFNLNKDKKTNERSHVQWNVVESEASSDDDNERVNADCEETIIKQKFWLQEENEFLRNECFPSQSENHFANERQKNINIPVNTVNTPNVPPAIPPRKARQPVNSHAGRTKEDLTFEEAHVQLHNHISWLEYKTLDEIEKIMALEIKKDGKFVTWYDIRKGGLKISVRNKKPTGSEGGEVNILHYNFRGMFQNMDQSL